MNTAEIVVGEVQGDSGFQVRQLLAESIREPRKTSHRHSHGQILPLHKRSANVSGVGVALSDFGYNPRDAWWGIPPAGAIELPEVAEQFGELGEIYVRPKALRNGHRIVVQSIRSELDAVSDAVIQVPQEGPRIRPHALADAKRRNQFAFRVNRNVNPLVPKLGRIAAPHVAPFLSDVAPDFINLQIPGVEFAHSRVHQLSAALASSQQKAHDRVAIQACEPFGAADRATLKKAVQCTLRRFGIRQEGITGELRVRLGKAGIAGSAFPTLDTPLTEVTEFLTGFVLAFGAGHVSFPLFLSGMTCYHEIASEVRVDPRFGLSGICGSSRRYRVCIYCYGGRISSLLPVIGPWILCWLAPTNHGPFANLPAKSSLAVSRAIYIHRHKTGRRSLIGFIARVVTQFSRPSHALQCVVDKSRRIKACEVIAHHVQGTLYLRSGHSLLLQSKNGPDGITEANNCRLYIVLVSGQFLSPNHSGERLNVVLGLNDAHVELVPLPNQFSQLRLRVFKNALRVCSVYSHLRERVK